MTTFVFKCQYLWSSNSLLRKYNQFGNLTLSFALFCSLKKNFNYKIFCRVTYVTGCYSLTLPLSRGLHVAKPLQAIGLQKIWSTKFPLGGGKPYPASGLFCSFHRIELNICIGGIRHFSVTADLRICEV